MSDSEFNAVVSVLSQGQVEIREDMRELIGSVNTLAKTQTESTTENRHTRKEVVDMRGDLEKFKDAIAPRVRKLEISKEQSRLKWWFLGVTVTAIISLAGFFVTTFVKPGIDVLKQSQANMIQGERTTKLLETIESIMIENYSKEKAEAIVKSNRGE